MDSISWRKKWQTTPAFLPGKSYGQRSLVSYSPWSCKDLDTIEHTHTDLYFSHIPASGNHFSTHYFCLFVRTPPPLRPFPHICNTMQYLSACLISLSIMPSSSIQVANARILFFLTAE